MRCAEKKLQHRELEAQEQVCHPPPPLHPPPPAYLCISPQWELMCFLFPLGCLAARNRVPRSWLADTTKRFITSQNQKAVGRAGSGQRASGLGSLSDILAALPLGWLHPKSTPKASYESQQYPEAEGECPPLGTLLKSKTFPNTPTHIHLASHWPEQVTCSARHVQSWQEDWGDPYQSNQDLRGRGRVTWTGSGERDVGSTASKQRVSCHRIRMEKQKSRFLLNQIFSSPLY